MTLADPPARSFRVADDRAPGPNRSAATGSPRLGSAGAESPGP